ncbi:hypothetical protein HMI54_015269 [Coelomomyces lativittatus]|nr:hypothetical protein HMI54_015269 [Coelomomyces lativittatus]
MLRVLSYSPCFHKFKSWGKQQLSLYMGSHHLFWIAVPFHLSILKTVKRLTEKIAFLTKISPILKKTSSELVYKMGVGMIDPLLHLKT